MLQSIRSNRGQVAVVVIFFVAIGLILYAATLSTTRVSQSKTFTTIASNMAAAKMVSLVASYGEKVYQEYLEGRDPPKYCKKTGGWLGGLFSEIMNIGTFGLWDVFWDFMESILPPTVYIIARFVAEPFSLHQTYIQPKITKMWNDQESANLDMVDYIMEQGIQTGLQRAVSDHVMVPDLYDVDMDGKFGDLASYDDMESADDYIARFVVLNTPRIMAIPKNAGDDIRSFITGLKNFIYVDDDYYSDVPDRSVFEPYLRFTYPDFGVYDPIDCSGGDSSSICCPIITQDSNGVTSVDTSQIPAECDPCCVPPFVQDGFGPDPDGSGDDPDCCDQFPQCPGDPLNDAEYPVYHCDGLPTDPACCGRADDDPTKCGGPDICSYSTMGLIPDCCRVQFGTPEYTTKCGEITTCAQRSQYRYPASGPGIDYTDTSAGELAYPYLFELKHDNISNSYYSIRELLGRDDEHAEFERDPNDPYNFAMTVPTNPAESSYPSGRQLYSISEGTLSTPAFHVQDATGYYYPGYYGDPTMPTYFSGIPTQGGMAGPQDSRMLGIFHVLNKIKNWGIGTADLDYEDDECHWCDNQAVESCDTDGDGACDAPRSYATGTAIPHPLATITDPLPPANFCDDSPDQLWLDLDGDGTRETKHLELEYEPGMLGLSEYSGGWCLDKVNSGNGGPQVLDKVPSVAASLFAEDYQCTTLPGDTSVSDPNTEGYFTLGWKEGSDRFCSEEFPYDIDCDKDTTSKDNYSTTGFVGSQQRTYLPCEDSYTDPSGASVDVVVPCGCGESYTSPQGGPPGSLTLPPGTSVASNASPLGWVDDYLDVVFSEMVDFINVGEQLVKTPISELITNFRSWYPTIADWIEPGCTDPECPNSPPCVGSETSSCCNCPGSATKARRQGTLHEWREKFRWFRDPLATWLGSTSVGDDVWCVPAIPAAGTNSYGLSEQDCIHPDEAATFDQDGDGIRGELDEVVACLDWNIEGQTMDRDETGTPVPYLDASGNPLNPLGNIEKFELCDTTPECLQNKAFCGHLPRSTVPGFCAQWQGAAFNMGLDPGVPAEREEMEALRNCYYSLDSVAWDPDGCNLGFAPEFQAPGVCPPVIPPTNYPVDVNGYIDMPVDGTGQYPTGIVWEYSDRNGNLDAGGVCPVNSMDPTDLTGEYWIGDCMQVPGAVAGTTRECGCFHSSADYILSCIQNCAGGAGFAFTENSFGAADVDITNYIDTDSGSYNPAYSDLFDRQDWVMPTTTAMDSLTPAEQEEWEGRRWFPPDRGHKWRPDMDNAELGPAYQAYISSQPSPPYYDETVDGYVDMQKVITTGGAIPPGVEVVASSDRDGNLISGGTCQVGLTGPKDLSGLEWLGCVNPLPLGAPTIGECICYRNSPIDYYTNPRSCSSSLFKNNVYEAWLRTGGTCQDQNFIADVQQSLAEARNQQAKMIKRKDFLEQRIPEVEYTNAVLTSLIDNLTDFLDGGTPYGTTLDVGGTEYPQDSPAELLIDRQINGPSGLKGLDSVAIYVWKDMPDNEGNPGEWHAVKVEGRVPMRCNNCCYWGGVCKNTPHDYPTILTYTKKHGMIRCYYLARYLGMVKARVIRYDQSRDAKTMTFPNGEPIWFLNFQHPDAKGVADPTKVVSKCLSPTDTTRFFGSARLKNYNGVATQHWREAFMLNENPLRRNELKYKQCWNAVHEEFLERGVVTDTCAQYFYAPASPTFGRHGFHMQFAPCDKGFRRGLK